MYHKFFFPTKNLEYNIYIKKRTYTESKIFFTRSFLITLLILCTANMYAVQEGIRLAKSDKEAKGYLMILMDQIDTVSHNTTGCMVTCYHV